MKITWTIGAIAVVAALGLGTAVAYAQTETPPAQLGGHGLGMGRGMRFAQGDGTYGPLHDDMIAALANGLGLSADDLKARLAKGETAGAIAQAKGMSLEQFRSLWQQARTEAVKTALAKGEITQAQADWMQQHSQSMGPNGNCPTWGGSGPVGSGPRGRWGTQPPAQP